MPKCNEAQTGDVAAEIFRTPTGFIIGLYRIHRRLSSRWPREATNLQLVFNGMITAILAASQTQVVAVMTHLIARHRVLSRGLLKNKPWSVASSDIREAISHYGVQHAATTAPLYAPPPTASPVGVRQTRPFIPRYHPVSHATKTELRQTNKCLSFAASGHCSRANCTWAQSHQCDGCGSPAHGTLFRECPKPKKSG